MSRLVRVSLRDVPEPLRRRAARPLLTQLAKDGGLSSLSQTVELERAVSFPSPRMYLVPAEAVERVLASD
jgi:hypothetical protein